MHVRPMVTPRLFLHFHGVGAGDLSRSPALWVSDLECMLCRSIVDRSIVCHPLVLPLSSFFFLSTDFSLPPLTFHLCGPHVNLYLDDWVFSLNSTRDCSQHLFFCVRFLCILCTQYHLCTARRDGPESDSVNKM